MLSDIHDREIRDDLRQTEARIMNEIRYSSSNLFTFAKSFPLVSADSSKLGSTIGDYAVSKF